MEMREIIELFISCGITLLMGLLCSFLYALRSDGCHAGVYPRDGIFDSAHDCISAGILRAPSRMGGNGISDTSYH